MPPQPVTMHFNASRGARARRAGYLLADWVDDWCAQRGLTGWWGEINAPVGRRAAALERLGGVVVHRVTNHTLSWLAGTPVERLTVARDLAARPSPGPSEPAPGNRQRI